MIDWIPVVFVTFKVLMFGTCMFFAINRLVIVLSNANSFEGIKLFNYQEFVYDSLK